MEMASWKLSLLWKIPNQLYKEKLVNAHHTVNFIWICIIFNNLIIWNYHFQRKFPSIKVFQTSLDPFLGQATGNPHHRIEALVSQHKAAKFVLCHCQHELEKDSEDGPGKIVENWWTSHKDFWSDADDNDDDDDYVGKLGWCWRWEGVRCPKMLRNGKEKLLLHTR